MAVSKVSLKKVDALLRHTSNDPEKAYALAQKYGYGDTITSDFLQKRSQELTNKLLGTPKPKQPTVDTSVLEDIQRGFGRSSLATPFSEPSEQQAGTFGGRLAESLGEIAGDVPAMAGGGSLGALGGGALGSLLGPLGAAIGALIGGGAGAFAGPEAIKSTAQEVRKGTPLSQALSNILYESGKSGVIGAATGIGGKVAGPLLKATGSKSVQQLLASALGRGAVQTAGELGGMTYGQQLTGQEPSLEGLAQNALLLGGLKGAGGIAKKLPIKTPKVPSFDGMLEKTPETKKYFSLLKDHVGERNAKTVESSFKWNEEKAKLDKQGKLTKQNLDDMTYYRQKTGNPKIEGDTFEALSSRVPEHAKKFVNEVVDTHLRDSLKSYNNNPYTRDINPRDGLQDIYLPGLYKNDPLAIRKAMNTAASKLKVKNPFANEKVFLTYADALHQAGLEPRYDNIFDLIKHYDQTMIKATANAEFANKINKLDSDVNKKLIVRSNEGDAYQKAEENGYVPFMDPFLRKKTGKPALVNPELAPAIQGIFNKDVYKPDSKPWQYYDSVSDTLKRMQVHIPLVDRIPGYEGSAWSLLASPFHTLALTEHGISDLGPRFLKWKKIGRQALANKEAVTDAVRHGLTIHGADVEGGRGKTYLFGKYQPSLKLGSYNKFVQSIENDLINKGTPPDAEQIKDIKRQAADFTNNLYGGQNWETLNWFNNPKNLKNARRAVAYIDWSTSAIRAAGMPFKAGYTGAQARKMWMKYGAFYFGSRALLDAFNNSLIQTDKDNAITGVRVDPNKFMENLTLVGKPGQEHLFGMPDVTVRIAGHDWNPGRDENGNRRFSHFGKSALEIGHYYSKPLAEMFSKSNPVFQSIYKQVVGSTPAEGGSFAVRRGYKYGQQVPWKGKQGFEQLSERAQELASSVAPFGIRGGLEQYAASGLGAVPISKGLTPFKARPLFEEILKAHDITKLNSLRKQLRDNGYTDKKINSEIGLVRNDLETRGILEESPKKKRAKKAK